MNMVVQFVAIDMLYWSSECEHGGGFLSELECDFALSVQAQTSALQSDSVFDLMKKRVAANAERFKKINGVFQYNITKDGATVATWSTYTIHCYELGERQSDTRGPNELYTDTTK